ncbi:MAG: hypothetical protein AAF805_06990 [Planctomycetota bacterium]
MIVAILLGVVSLAVLVFAFLASKQWHWAHVLFAVAFYFSAVGYAVLAARSLDTRLTYQEQLDRSSKQLASAREEADAMEHGTGDRRLIGRLSRTVTVPEDADRIDGVTRMQHLLKLTNRDRGRVWRFATPTGPVDPQTGAVMVGFPVDRPAAPSDEEDGFGAAPPDETPEEPAGPPPALGLEAGAVVYVFEQGPLEGEEGAPTNRYLGEFRVEDVAGREAQLEPLDQLELDPVAGQRLIDSVGPWIVYETMPADSHDLFAEMDDETLRRLMPAETVAEYLRHDGEATPDDPPGRLAGFDADGAPVMPDDLASAVTTRYQRMLRDYAVLLNDYERERAELVTAVQGYRADIASLETALAGARQTEKFRREEIGMLRDDLRGLQREREALDAHVAAVQRQLATARELLDATLAENARLATAKAAERGPLAPIGSGAIDIDAL